MTAKIIRTGEWQRSRLIAVVAMVALVTSAILAAKARATVTIGSSMSYPGDNIGIDCGSPTGDCTYAFLQHPGVPRRTASPVNGTVVGWSVAVAGAPAPVRLRVVQLVQGVGGNGVAYLHSSSTELATTTGINRFAATVPIGARQRIAVDDPDALVLVQTGVLGAQYGSFATQPDGSGASPGAFESAELLLSAEIEPTNTFSVTRKRVHGRGKATVFLGLPNPGTLSVESVARGKSAATAVRARKPLVTPFTQGISGSVREMGVFVAATKATKARLKQEGKVKGRLTLTFTPDGGTPFAQTIGLTLKLKR
jgi:hypothetical protein